MPVDITVTVDDAKHTLFERRNVDHGKFAFVVPLDEGTIDKVLHAEMRRKSDHEHTNHVHHAHIDTIQDTHHRRRLLSIDDDKKHSEEHGANANHHTAHDVNHPEPPHDLHDTHPDNHMHDHEHSHQHHDDDHYSYDDDMSHFDMEDYDGIDDGELDQEIARNERQYEKNHDALDTQSDSEKEHQLFDLKKFEICLSNNGDSQGRKRRVRLVINKGRAAHDYTKLAKKEHMTHLEVSLRQVSGELSELLVELDQAKQMEDVLRKLNEATNRRVVMLSVLALMSLFAAGGYQAFYTKRFFKRKKIL